MGKLYFYFGAMGSSKTAIALMQRFNFIEQGISVLLLKPSIDTRDGENILASRIGLSAPVIMVKPMESIKTIFQKVSFSIIIVDEAHFLSSEQIEELRKLVDTQGISVYCYGLRTDFTTKMFEGSKRLFEIADRIEEIKTVCKCGRPTIVNARFANGKIINQGDQICIGGNDLYKPMCFNCWKKK